MDVTIEATLTGGTSKHLTSAGYTPGKASFVLPDHTRLTPETVEFSVGGSNTGANPVGRTGMKLTLIDRQVEDGCCSVHEGAVIVDLGLRWSLNQPEALADKAIAYLRGFVYTAEFAQMVKSGILPSP